MARINVTGGYMSGAIGAIVSLHAKHYAVGLDPVSRSRQK